MNTMERLRLWICASPFKRVILCFSATLIAFIVWKLLLGKRFFSIGVQIREEVHVYALIYFFILFCFLCLSSNVIRNKKVYVLIPFSLLVGYITSGLSFKLFDVWICILYPRFACFRSAGIKDLLFLAIGFLPQMSFFIALTAVMLLRFAWRMIDKVKYSPN